jgi:hypothetical protein
MQRLLVFERVDDAGRAERTYLERDDDTLLLVIDERSARIPDGALEAVMRRYGRVLDQAVVAEGAALELGAGRRLVHLRFRPRYDVIARDYLVLEAPPEPPLVELSTSVVAALTHLARVAE